MVKSISGSVGRGGRNHPAQDVLTVQYLLNCVPASRGGPKPELVLDGICGPKTIQAIDQFQRRSFNSSDGRVDAGGQTLRALQQFDPAPGQALGPGGSSKGAPGGKSAPWEKSGFGPGAKTGGDPFHKGTAKQGGDPFYKVGSKQGPGGPGSNQGGDPFHKSGSPAPAPGGKSGGDPFSKGGYKLGPGGKFG